MSTSNSSSDCTVLDKSSGTGIISMNVILHLKCGFDDMHSNSISIFKYEPTVEVVQSYTDSNDISETAGEFSSSTKSNHVNINTDNHHGIAIHNDICIQNHADNTNDNDIDIDNDITCDNTDNDNKDNNNPLIPARIHKTVSSALFSHNHIHDHIDTLKMGDNTSSTTDSMKDIWKKINKLKVTLHNDNAIFNAVQQSACFWDTCKFTTPVIHIPKLYNKVSDSYTVYGCFCSPECAAAYLIREPLDSSVKFERLQMLNGMYNDICNNTDRPVKPAPDPRYVLNKYYGNLTIEEYRKLLKSDHLLYVVNKPLTHSLPELYDDNNEFLVNGKPAAMSSMSSGSSSTSSSSSFMKNKTKYPLLKAT
jgi:hypothetical protein